MARLTGTVTSAKSGGRVKAALRHPGGKLPANARAMDVVELAQHRLAPVEALRGQGLDREEDKCPPNVPPCRQHPWHQFGETHDDEEYK